MRPTTTLLACLLAGAATAVLAQAPTNDTRATAFELNADRVACVPTRDSTGNATASGTIPSCAPATQTAAARDLWYRFDAAQAEMTVYAEIDDGDNNSLRVEVTDADGAVVECAAFSYSEAVRRIEGLTVGATYFIQLAHTDPTHVNQLKVCAYRTPSCLPVENVRMSTGQNWTRLTYSGNDADAVGYQIRVGPRRRFDPNNDEPIAELVTDDNRRAIIWDLEPGEAYDFFVRQICGPGDTSVFAGPTQLFLQEPAGRTPNDERAGEFRAEIIGSASSGCFGQPGSTRFATASSLGAGGCAAVGPDVWYELNPIAPRYTFAVEAANGTSADLALEFWDNRFEGTDWVGQRIACVDDGGPGESETFTLNTSSLPLVNGRATVYVRVVSADGAPADFLICGSQDAPAVLEPDGCALPVFADFDGTGAAGALVDVLTDEGQIVCAIENTAALGQVVVSAYGFPGGETRRLGGDGPAYADRSVTIDVSTQPTAPVLVRFYLSAADIAGLIAAGAFPADGQFGTEELLAIARVAQTSCSVEFPGEASAVEFVAAGPYGDGAYYVDVRVSGFSEFFFSGVADPLPTTTVGVRTAPTTHPLQLAPNPARRSVTVTLPQNFPHAAPLAVQVSDATGRVVSEAVLPKGATAVSLDVSGLAAGLYAVRGVGGADVGVARLLIQR